MNKDDGLHYRHPWVVAVQEEIKTLSTRLDEAEEVVKGVWKLNKRIKDLEVSVLVTLFVSPCCSYQPAQISPCCSYLLHCT